MALDSSLFDDIITELRRQPLELNEYRVKVGSGRTQTFGIVNRRSMPPDYSRQNWKRPYLYKLLLDFGKEYVDISFNAITVNQNYRAGPHRDRGNVGDSYLVAFGDYSGGELVLHEGPLAGELDIRHTPFVTDFSVTLHSVKPFTGERYSLVYYTFKEIPKWGKLCLPPATVRQEEGNYYFYRGDVKITRETRIDHHLKGRIQKKLL